MVELHPLSRPYEQGFESDGIRHLVWTRWPTQTITYLGLNGSRIPSHIDYLSSGISNEKKPRILFLESGAFFLQCEHLDQCATSQFQLESWAKKVGIIHSANSPYDQTELYNSLALNHDLKNIAFQVVILGNREQVVRKTHTIALGSQLFGQSNILFTIFVPENLSRSVCNANLFLLALVIFEGVENEPRHHELWGPGIGPGPIPTRPTLGECDLS